MLYEFDYAAPKSQKELLSLLNDRRGEAVVLAGGTDLLVNIRFGVKKPRLVVDLKRIPAHRKITFGKEGLSIGAGITISQLITNATVRTKYPALVAAGQALASHQLRNRATVIGNLVNASPCADMAPPLLCLGARVVVVSAAGSRELPLPEFFVGVKKTQLRSDEYVERVIVPANMANAAAGFKKLKRVKGHDIGVLSVALVKKGKLMRIAVGSAAPTPVLLPDLTSSTSPQKACEAAQKTIKPIDDVRGSADFRRHMTNVYIKRLMKEIR